ncbi:homeobox protein TGIF2LX-like [Saccopteryx leptura]|uniref:homeobox protein TGIF2LX-like n=1 Tax=Saccopteryx leptura TaxID=249018 RepID=UPI00339C43D6
MLVNFIQSVEEGLNTEILISSEEKDSFADHLLTPTAVFPGSPDRCLTADFGFANLHKKVEMASRRKRSAPEESTSSATQSSPQGTSVFSDSATGTDEIHVPQEGRKREEKPPAEPEKILHQWLFEHRFKAYPSEAEKRMLSEQTSLSLPQINTWFANARKHILPNMLEQNRDNPTDTTIYHQKGKQRKVNLPTQAKSESGSSEIKSPPASPPPMAQELGGELLKQELDQGHKPKTHSEEEAQTSTSAPLSSPEPISSEAYTDFSNFYLLVDVAVQKALELELQKKQESDP